jgi:non-heme chloroperoxidase
VSGTLACLTPLRISVLLVAAVALTACGGAHRTAGPPAPILASICTGVPDGLDAKTSWLETSDGLRLYSASAGSGDTTVVLAHESGGVGLCGWLPTMRFLAQHGFRALAFDFRGVYPSPLPPARTQYDWGRDLQAAVDAAHTKHVVLAGASFGGAAVVAFGPDLHGIDGIASFSGEPDLPTPHIHALANAPRLRVPLFVVASRLDGYLDTAEARRLVRAAGSQNKELVLFPGRLHGWDILDERAKARADFLTWITRLPR